MMHFKHRTDEDDWPRVDGLVRWLVQDLDDFLVAHGVAVSLITSVTSPADGRKSQTHEEFRAADVSFSGFRDKLTVCEEWADRTNGFIRMGGGMKPVIVGKYDPSGAHDNHFHIQAPRPCWTDRTIMVV